VLQRPGQANPAGGPPSPAFRRHLPGFGPRKGRTILTDEELQAFLDWGRNPYSFEQLRDDWKTWAKTVIEGARVDTRGKGSVRRDDAVLYLCQIMQVLEGLCKGITEDDLRGKFVSGLVVSGLPPETDGSFYFLRALQDAQSRGYVTAKEVGWGNESQRFYQLELAGQRFGVADFQQIDFDVVKATAIKCLNQAEMLAARLKAVKATPQDTGLKEKIERALKEINEDTVLPRWPTEVMNALTIASADRPMPYRLGRLSDVCAHQLAHEALYSLWLEANFAGAPDKAEYTKRIQGAADVVDVMTRHLFPNRSWLERMDWFEEKIEDRKQLLSPRSVEEWCGLGDVNACDFEEARQSVIREWALAKKEWGLAKKAVQAADDNISREPVVVYHDPPQVTACAVTATPAKFLDEPVGAKPGRGEGNRGANDPQAPVDATQLPSAPSSLAELPDWIQAARERLQGQKDRPIGASGTVYLPVAHPDTTVPSEQVAVTLCSHSLAYTLREQFLDHLERLYPTWKELLLQFHPERFRTVRELVTMMAWVGDALEASKAQPENEDKAKRIKGFDEASRKSEWVFACYGTTYEIAGWGERPRLKWMAGLGYIEKLLRRAGEAIEFAELVGDDAPERATEAAEQTADENLELDKWSDQPALDRQAFREYHERLNEIDTELEDARQCNDSGRQERLEREKEEILAAFQAAKGLGNNTRNLNTDADKLRSRISVAIRRACKKLADNQAPKLAQHFKESISAERGAFRYAPKLTTPKWSFDQEQR